MLRSALLFALSIVAVVSTPVSLAAELSEFELLHDQQAAQYIACESADEHYRGRCAAPLGAGMVFAAREDGGGESLQWLQDDGQVVTVWPRTSVSGSPVVGTVASHPRGAFALVSTGPFDDRDSEILLLDNQGEISDRIAVSGEWQRTWRAEDGGFMLRGPGSAPSLVARIDSDGGVAWQVDLAAPDSMMQWGVRPQFMVDDGADTIITAMYFIGDGYDVRTWRLSSNGNVSWKSALNDRAQPPYEVLSEVCIVDCMLNAHHYDAHGGNLYLFVTPFSGNTSSPPVLIITDAVSGTLTAEYDDLRNLEDTVPSSALFFDHPIDGTVMLANRGWVDDQDRLDGLYPGGMILQQFTASGAIGASRRYNAARSGNAGAIDYDADPQAIYADEALIDAELHGQTITALTYKPAVPGSQPANVRIRTLSIDDNEDFSLSQARFSADSAERARHFWLQSGNSMRTFSTIENPPMERTARSRRIGAPDIFLDSFAQ